MNKDKQTDYLDEAAEIAEELVATLTAPELSGLTSLEVGSRIVQAAAPIIEDAARKRIEEGLQKRLSNLRVLEEMRHGEDDAVSAEIVAYESVLASLPSRGEQ